MSCIIDQCINTLQGDTGQLFLLLIQTLVNTQCSLDPVNLYQKNYGAHLRDGEEYDYIIIGAGSAGSVIANRLSEDENTTILLVEAGGIPSVTSEMPLMFMSTQLTNEDWQYVTEPNKNACLGMVDKVCRWPRGRMLGGTSGIHANLYIRGYPYDYDNWSELGNTGWSYEEVLPYFIKSENCLRELLVDTPESTHGVDGYLTTNYYRFREPIKPVIFSAAKELGFEVFDDQPVNGYYESLVTIANGTRCSSAVAFLASIKDCRPNLHLAYNTFAEKIVFEGTRATGVTVKYEGGGKNHDRVHIRARKEVILSAGAINSPQILMLSGIGPRKHLDKFDIEVVADLNVGDNLQDHLTMPGFAVKVNDSCALPWHGMDYLYDYFMHRDNVFSTMGILNLLGFTNTDNVNEVANIMFNHVLFPRNDSTTLQTFLVARNYKLTIVNSFLEANLNSAVLFIMPTLLTPKSIGKIRLTSKDPRDKVNVTANYFTDCGHEDMDTLVAGIRIAEAMITTDSFAQCAPEIVLVDLPECDSSCGFGTDSYWKCSLRQTATTMYHPVGTCKMGTDSEAVVNERLVVKGVTGLRVADASIIPYITGGGINAVAIMIGEKASDMIKEDAGGLESGEGTEEMQCEGIEESEENDELKKKRNLDG